MRIAILGTAHPYRGGLAAFNERLAEACLEAGHTVEVVTYTLQYPGFLFPGESQTDERPAPRGYRVTRKLNSVNPVSYLSTGRYLLGLRPDLIICKFWLPFMGPALGTALRVGRRGGAHVVSIVDNIIPHERRPGDRPFARYFAGAVDDFVVMSRSVESDMAGFADTRQRVVFHPHPIYDNFGDPAPRAGACERLGLDPALRYLLFFGFIRDYKGLDLLLDAVALLRAEAPELMGATRLIVAGEYYGNREAYAAQIERLGIGEGLVLHTDFIANEAVRDYFSVAELVVQPYKSATQSGISQMSYHFGVPMVVTRVGGLPEIVPDGEAGFVTEVSAPAVAAAVRRFLELPAAEREAFRQNVRRLARQYAWPALVRVLEQLCATRGGGGVATVPSPDDRNAPA